MAPSAPAAPGGTRCCPFCGVPVAVSLNRCPFCREEIKDVHSAGPAYAKEARAKMRRGLLYILLAGIIHYFAAGYSGFHLPIAVPALVTAYLTPLLFLAGVGFELYGAYLYVRS
jgi:hypothetical protein